MSPLRCRALLLMILGLWSGPCAWGADSSGSPAAQRSVVVVSDEVRAALELDVFYQKHVDADGLPILSSARVSEAAMLEAARLVDALLAQRDDVRQELVARDVRIVVMAPDEMTTDVPEQRHMNKEYWDRRARGLGGRICSCGEENLLNLPGDRYSRENILIHEFAHTLHNFGFKRVDEQFQDRLEALYRAAREAGLWENTYAGSNVEEYWAEGVQAYFDCNAPPQPRVHNDVDTREELAAYDPGLYALIDESFRGTSWRYVRYDQRGADEISGPVSSPQQRGRRRGGGMNGVYRARIEPHWYADGAKFWYRNDLAGGAREFVRCDAARGVREPAFDHARLAAALSAAAGREIDPSRLPFDAIVYRDDETSLRFVLDDVVWQCRLDSYAFEQVGEADGDLDGPELTEPPRTGRRPWQARGRRAGDAVVSPDGRWEAFVRDDNVFLRPRDDDSPADGSDRAEIQLSRDGSADARYGLLEWSPDGQALAAFRIEPGDRKEVYLLESSPEEGGRARFTARPYDLPGDRLTSYELRLFNVAAKSDVRPLVDKIDLGYPEIFWDADGRHFLYEQVDRGHQRLRVMRVDAHTGAAHAVIDEQTDTFIWTAHDENLDLERVNWLPDSGEIVYASEQDGWRHLYLIDGRTGAQKQITRGSYVVRGIEWIDVERRQIWFQASGGFPDQDPYFIHHYRVNFDGSELVALTEADGTHSVQFSPDRAYLIDTYSRVDQPPRHELRRTADGSLVCLLEEADASELMARDDYHPLEPFVAKGRDGVTDIWGVICRPRDFDPAKKYPVIENIYAGPQGSFVPKTFNSGGRYAALADRGFIVVQIDGMGTANRSKAFHDACWHNLKDAGFADRILWLQAAAAQYPAFDLSRVGVYGGSAGGQNAAAAVLFHPEFYRVAVAGCGCHDNRMDKASWNEQWMGYPVGPQYAASSNIENAARLQGKLMLILGELDDNVPVESTYRFVDALIKAGKDFEFVLVPGAGHGMGGEYGVRRMHDFFVRHLQGVEPPDHNAPQP